MTAVGDAIAADEQTMAELGEFGLIAALSRWLPPGPGPLVGIGDDAAVLAAPDGRVVASTDFLLEGRHFRRDWSSGADVGAKAAARSLIDVAAMGAVPTGLLVALAAPPDLLVTWARDLVGGLAAECARAGATVVGGDTARAGSVLLVTTVLGDLAGRPPVLRSGAAPGDLVAVTGPLGRAAAGLALLQAGLPDGALQDAQRRPEPPYDAGPQAAGLGATAMIDISDGLLADLGHVASASGVRIDLSSDRLTPGEDLQAAALSFFGRTGRGPCPPHELAQSRLAQSRLTLAWVLTGGEDHALAATFKPDVALPPRWTVIGTVCHGNGVLVDGQAWAGEAGWDHFRPLTGELARLDAGGAHVHPAGRAAHDDPPALDVGVEAARSAAVGERDVFAEARPLTAHVADGSHGLLQRKRGR
jgi:thiamine-monophosphate kinase